MCHILKLTVGGDVQNVPKVGDRQDDVAPTRAYVEELHPPTEALIIRNAAEDRYVDAFEYIDEEFVWKAIDVCGGRVSFGNGVPLCFFCIYDGAGPSAIHEDSRQHLVGLTHESVPTIATIRRVPRCGQRCDRGSCKDRRDQPRTNVHASCRSLDSGRRRCASRYGK